MIPTGDHIQISSSNPAGKPRVGVIGFGKTGRAVVSILLQAQDVELRWVIRQSERLSHRSIAEYLGTDEQNDAEILSSRELSADALLTQKPVDIIVDFSGVDGIGYYGEAAARRGVTILTAISQYPSEIHLLLHQLALRTRVIHSPKEGLHKQAN